MITYAVDYSENGRDWLALTNSDITSVELARAIARAAWESGIPQTRIAAFDPEQGAIIVAIYK